LHRRYNTDRSEEEKTTTNRSEEISGKAAVIEKAFQQQTTQ
jgi:hypothetical protein